MVIIAAGVFDILFSMDVRWYDWWIPVHITTAYLAD